MNIYIYIYIDNILFQFFIHLLFSYSIKIKVDKYVNLNRLRWICKANVFIYLILSKKLKVKNK